MTTHRLLVDGRTPMNYAMFAPVHDALRRDRRVAVDFIASEEPRRARTVYADAGDGARIVGRGRAALTKYDAYLTSDFMWTRHLRTPRRIQMFHGVGGKYGFDAPTESLAAWDRLFFVNQRRLRNCVAAGAIAADSPAVRLIGMPKVDCLVDGSLQREAVLRTLALPADRPTVLYAPTWSPASSLNAIGIALIEKLKSAPVNVIIKLHDRSLDRRPHYSGGVDWAAAIAPLLEPGRVVLASAADICPCLAAADAMITDHSSCGFEYLLLDRPVVRIHVPELIALANVHPDYVALLADVSESTTGVDDTVSAVERGLADPSARSRTRRAVAAELFHAPGAATAHCVAALYEVFGLEPTPEQLRSSARPGAARTDAVGHRALNPSECQPSA